MRCCEKGRTSVKYEKLDGYYRVRQDITYETLLTGHSLDIKYQDELEARLEEDGKLVCFSGCEWNGANWVPDTKDFMDGSLAHDKLYDALKILRLPKKEHKAARKLSDKTMSKINREHGMGWFRDMFTFLGVRLGGRSNAKRFG